MNGQAAQFGILLGLLILLVVLLGMSIATYMYTDDYSRKHARRLARMHIVTSHWGEDLRWLGRAKFPVTVLSKIGAPKSTAPFQATARLPNSGREASAYLAYIVANYDDLPEFVAFLHGHESAWHQKAGPILKQLDTLATRLDTVRFHTLNRCFTKVWDAADESYAAMQQYWPKVFAPWLGPMPKQLCYDCCAQFVVSRDAIRQRPLAAYKAWLAFTQDPAVRKTEYMFEYTWHLIFGEDACVQQADWPINQPGA